jgi:hypothetical protein
MTNAANTSGTATAAAPAKVWPQRFGTMTNVQIKTSRKGEYAIITVDCSKFTQVAFVFGATLVAKVKAAGIGSKVWFKGPVEAVERKNENGGTYTEDQMKVVYFKDKTVREDAAASDESTSDDSTTADQAADTGASNEGTAAEMTDAEMDDEIPF